MYSKKQYWLGIGLLAFACLLMHLFAKSLENLRLLHYVLESLGYYTGYLDNPLTRWLWPILIIAVIVLVPLALRVIRRAYDKKTVKKRYRVLPVCILLVSIISCLTFPFVHGLFLRIPGRLDTVMFDYRAEVTFATVDPYSSNPEYDLLLCFFKLSPGDEQFYVKFVDLNDSANEKILDFPLDIHSNTGGWRRVTGILDLLYYTGHTTFNIVINLENIPGYDPELNNWRDLRFKIVIFNENESKTIYPYFRDWPS